MRGIASFKKLTTEPQNNLKLNKSHRVAADNVFSETVKQKIDRTNIPASKALAGKERYEVINEIGNGTFGSVFQARDKKTL